MKHMRLVAAAVFLGLLTLGELLSYEALVAFIVGMVVALLGMPVGIYFALTIGEQKAAKARDLAVQKTTEHTASVPEERYVADAQHEGYLQVHNRYFNKPTSTWLWGSLKANMLLWQDTKGNKGCARLDDCTISVVKTKEGGLWKPRNYIKIFHPDREVCFGQNECHIFCRTGKEMEEWFHALVKGSRIASKSHLDSIQRIRNVFNEVIHRIGGSSPKEAVNVDWFNALAHRIFYNVHQDPGFTYKLSKTIQKKFDKVKKPSMLKELTLKSVNFGPRLPIISNVQLLSLSPDGEIKLDADVKYFGGFQMTFDIVIDFKILGQHMVIPVTVSVTVKKLSGKLRLHSAPPPADRVWIGFHQEPEVDIDISSVLKGTGYDIASIPKVASIIVYKLKQEIVEMMVLPEMDDIPIPGLKLPPEQEKKKIVVWEYAPGVGPSPPPKKNVGTEAVAATTVAPKAPAQPPTVNLPPNAAQASNSASTSTAPSAPVSIENVKFSSTPPPLPKRLSSNSYEVGREMTDLTDYKQTKAADNEKRDQLERKTISSSEVESASLDSESLDQDPLDYLSLSLSEDKNNAFSPKATDITQNVDSIFNVSSATSSNPFSKPVTVFAPNNPFAMAITSDESSQITPRPEPKNPESKSSDVDPPRNPFASAPASSTTRRRSSSGSESVLDGIKDVISKFETFGKHLDRVFSKEPKPDNELKQMASINNVSLDDDYVHL